MNDNVAAWGYLRLLCERFPRWERAFRKSGINKFSLSTYIPFCMENQESPVYFIKVLVLSFKNDEIAQYKSASSFSSSHAAWRRLSFACSTSLFLYQVCLSLCCLHAVVVRSQTCITKQKPLDRVSPNSSAFYPCSESLCWRLWVCWRNRWGTRVCT